MKHLDLRLWVLVGLIYVGIISVSAQDITWSAPQGITGDPNILISGNYFDAFLTSTNATANLTVDGITFNRATSSSSTSATDGKISFTISSGTNNPYQYSSFPTTSPSSAAFAAVMDSGGTYETGGSGAGTVVLSGLTANHVYAVQVFNYATDGDAGLTTLSGTNPVTLSNLPNSGGSNTNGEYVTGTFKASGSTESFNWTGAGSSYTVLGSISMRDITLSGDQSLYSFAVGVDNIGGGNPNSWVPTDPLFEVGNGGTSGYGNPTVTGSSDAFIVYKSGDASLAGTLQVSPGGEIPMYTGN